MILLGLVSAGAFPMGIESVCMPTASPFIQQSGNGNSDILAYLGDTNTSQNQTTDTTDTSSPDLSIVQDSALVSSTMPLSPWLYFDGRKEILEYSVKSGDTIASVAEEFEISQQTILWANDLSKGASLKAGQTLIILPVSGILYQVKNGDSLSSIAQKYKAEKDRIIAFNELSNESDITIGDRLVIPDGTMPTTVKIISPQISITNSYFILPTKGRISQKLHYFNAVDIANSCGSPIYAAAGGTVIKVGLTTSTSKSANFGAGSYIKILHPNGTFTYYGHVSASYVNVGDKVSQGQIIASVGGKPGTPGAGRSTGCHVHFEIGGARNPFAY